MVEVDATDIGVGAVLSQCSEDGKLHPCAFLSHQFSPSERNYNVGNREFLAVRLAIEERQHWLEGSKLHLVVWTGHKKRLNTRQARWVLFFGHFNFSLTYRPHSKNAKC